MQSSDDILISCSHLSRSYTKTLKTEGFGAGVRNLFRRRKTVVPAVLDFSFTLRRGEFLGLVGPNGAGKTTLVKMLSGLIRPHGGELSVLGRKPGAREEAFLSRIALVMGQKSQLWWDLPALDSFRLNKAIYDIDERRYQENLDRLSSTLSVRGLLSSPVRSLSLGERMRMELIAALLHEPDLLFLDEPTIGMDAPSQKAVRDFLLEEHRHRGLSLILTSHYMEDIRKLCPRSILIQGGRKRFDGPTSEMLRGMRAQRKVRVILAQGSAGQKLPADARDVGPEGFSLVVPAEMVQARLREVLDGYEIADLRMEEEEIEDTVIKLYRTGEAS